MSKSEIAKLYEDVMSNSDPEKLAADNNAASEADKVANDQNTDPQGDGNDGGDLELDADFWHKVASGDEKAVEIITNFVSEAEAEGMSADEIEATIQEAMTEAGVTDEAVAGDADGQQGGDTGDGDPAGDDAGDDYVSEHDQEKAAAYEAGSDKAMEEILESDLAKEAGVTLDDFIDYDNGGYFAAGYYETRTELEPVLQKIAAKKQAAAEAEKQAAAPSNVKGAVSDLVRSKTAGDKTASKGGAAAAKMKDLLGKAKGVGGKAVDLAKANPRKAMAMGAGGAAGLGAAGYAATRKKKKS